MCVAKRSNGKPLSPHPCPGCAGPVYTNSFAQIYCSAGCWWAHCKDRDATLAPYGMKYGATCQTCHGQFVVPLRQAMSGNRRFCSQNCQWISLGMADPDSPRRECKTCGKEYNPKRKGRDSFCGRECAFVFQGYGRVWRKFVNARLKDANKDVKPYCKAVGCQSLVLSWNAKVCEYHLTAESILTDNTRRYPSGKTYKLRIPIGGRVEVVECSTCSCSFEYTRHNQGIAPKLCDACRLESFKRQRKAARSMRRARKAGVPRETIDRMTVAQRDKWRCGLCGKKISKHAVWPDDNALEIDHIVPLSRGGHHMYYNVQATHRRCNYMKQDKPMGEQIRLEF
jgi:5-methylcytosine-specific restriction endonuclease McrA/endogenous inhibitor of DNA gyrase (YacG/DUF329 family)